MNKLSHLTATNWFPIHLRVPVYAEHLNTVIDAVNQLSQTTLVPTAIDCSGNPNYPAMVTDEIYYVSVAGKIGGGSGISVSAGDVIICIADSVSGDQSTVGAYYEVISSRSDLGTGPTPVSTRTNHPIIAANTVNANISALDNAIGADNTPVARTNNPVVVATTIEAKIQALDNAVGVTPTSTNYISASNSVNVNLSAVDTELAALALGTAATQVATVTVSWSGGTGTFKLPATVDQAVTNLDLGAVVPAKSRVLDVACITTTASTFSGGATTLVAGLGNATGGTQFSTSHSIYALNAINADGLTLTSPVAINSAASHVWLTGITPGANWSTQTAGAYTVYITYITY